MLRHRHSSGSYQDYHQVVDYLSYLESDEVILKYIEYLWYRTKVILSVDYWWLAVERLAEQLLVHKNIKAKRIREIIQQAVDEDFHNKERRHHSQPHDVTESGF